MSNVDPFRDKTLKLPDFSEEPSYQGKTLIQVKSAHEADTILSLEQAVEQAPSSISMEKRTSAMSPFQSEAHVEFGSRYENRETLGSGGMGEVRLCRDQRIGRDVAVKQIRNDVQDLSDVLARFTLEAQVQGQLEHPSIVPVYDLGVDEFGRAYFTMKRVNGRTLDGILQGEPPSVVDDDTAVLTFSRHRLIGIFLQVCQAIAYAHDKGVVHRDLKPTNIMIGDYGEVYVLDWGLAKLLARASSQVMASVKTSEKVARQSDPNAAQVQSDPGSSPETLLGALLGTPGYMAPEQARGESHLIDARTDIYALGAILFEIVTGTTLHRGANSIALLASTVKGVDARPSSRGVDVDPLLESICVKATALEPSDRYPSVRLLIHALEAYLDSERDSSRRRELADRHAQNAEILAEKVLLGDHTTHEDRAAAMREVGQALALYPQHGRALQVMTKLLTTLPKEAPKEASDEFDETELASRRNTTRMGSIAYMCWVLLVPILVSMGVRDIRPILLFVVTAVISALVAFLKIGIAKNNSWSALSVLILSTANVASLSMLFGPFVIVPAFAAANTTFFTVYTSRGAQRFTVLAIGTLAVLVPIALELLHVIPPSFRFEQGGLLLLPRAVDYPPVLTILLLIGSAIAPSLIHPVLLAQLRDEARVAEKSLFLHLWQIRQIVPEQVHHVAKVKLTEAQICSNEMATSMGEIAERIKKQPFERLTRSQRVPGENG